MGSRSSRTASASVAPSRCMTLTNSLRPSASSSLASAAARLIKLMACSSPELSRNCCTSSATSDRLSRDACAEGHGRAARRGILGTLLLDRRLSSDGEQMSELPRVVQSNVSHDRCKQRACPLYGTCSRQSKHQLNNGIDIPGSDVVDEWPCSTGCFRVKVVQPPYKASRSFRVAESSSALVEAGNVTEDAAGLSCIAELAQFNAVGQGLTGDPEVEWRDYRVAGVVGVLVEVVGKVVCLPLRSRWTLADGGQRPQGALARLPCVLQGLGQPVVVEGVRFEPDVPRSGSFQERQRIESPTPSRRASIAAWRRAFGACGAFS